MVCACETARWLTRAPSRTPHRLVQNRQMAYQSATPHASSSWTYSKERPLAVKGARRPKVAFPTRTRTFPLGVLLWLCCWRLSSGWRQWRTRKPDGHGGEAWVRVVWPFAVVALVTTGCHPELLDEEAKSGSQRLRAARTRIGCEEDTRAFSPRPCTARILIGCEEHSRAFAPRLRAARTLIGSEEDSRAFSPRIRAAGTWL